MKPVPPVLPCALLRRVLGQSADSRAIEGDLLEDFALLAAQRGVGAARRWYWREAISLSVSCAVKRLAEAIRPRHEPTTPDNTMANSLGT